MDACGGESLTPASGVSVKEEIAETLQTVTEQNVHESQQQSSYNNEEDSEQQIECTTESQESDIRAFLSKCVFCNKTFASTDDLKLLECLHTICVTCVADKCNDQNTSVETEVLGMCQLCACLPRNFIF